MRKLFLYTVYTVSLLLTGCATDMSVYTAMSNTAYINDCTLPTSKHRPGDDACRYRNEPAPQPHSVVKIVSRPDQIDYSRPDVISYCRRMASRNLKECEPVNGR